ncbi:MAG: hypothetical protein KF900_01065 [Bacteroidetes bacterium]|nr:hypothetical protein [Bacteroidota bacterium]
MKRFLPFILFALALPLAAQTSYDELEFEEDELESSYKTTGKNYVLLKSKRGESGMNTAPEADALVSAKSKIKEIVLVYTETKEDDYDSREDANRERWENLIRTYPQFFQANTVYKSICQCVMGGNADALKKIQGFYVYVSGALPQVQAETPPPPTASNPPAPKETSKQEVSQKSAEVSQPSAAKQETKPAETPKQEVARQEPKTVEPETPKQEPVKQETKTAEIQKDDVDDDEPIVKKATSAKKTANPNRPRIAKDKKACRPACYGMGDEDLLAFFKDNIPLTKKERKKAKSWVAAVNLQLNMDGSVKKSTVKGANAEFNKRVETVLKSMNNWNAAVKNGRTTKAVVNFNLKYDKASKTMRPTDFNMNPRPSPKCPCVSDSELFDD